MKAMVLAAGVGSRLDPLTAQLPKPLVPVANIPVMEHIVNLLKRHGVDDIIANLHYLPEKLIEYFQDGSRDDVRIQFRKEEKLSGDAGGVRYCRDFLDGDTFIVLMGDLLTDADLSRVIEEHKRKGALATIGLKRVKDVSHFGVALLDNQGFIKGFQEKPKAQDALSDLASTGIYILEPEVFEHMPKSGDYGFGRQLFPKLVAEGLPVLGVEVGSYWSDVGTIEQYALSNFDVLMGRLHVSLPGYRKVVYGPYNVFLAEGASLAPTVNVRANAIIGKNAHLGAGVELVGNVVIGDNCRVDDYAYIKDSILWSSMVVAADQRLENQILTSAGLTSVKAVDGDTKAFELIQTQVRYQAWACV